MCAVDQPVAMASVGLTQKPSQEKHCWLCVSRWSRSSYTVHLSPLAHHGTSKPKRHFGEGSLPDTLPLYGLTTKRREEVSSRCLVYHVLSHLLLALSSAPAHNTEDFQPGLPVAVLSPPQHLHHQTESDQMESSATRIITLELPLT